MKLAKLVISSTALAALVAATPHGLAQPHAPEPGRKTIPAEERRLSTAVFRDGLKQRGLHDLLELHLKDFPLQSPIDERLMQRDVELSRSVDPARTPQERSTALQAANGILGKLLTDHPTDGRRFQWMYALGYSLVFRVAEQYATNILYFGGSAQDRDQLQKASDEAVAVLRRLSQAVENEYQRIDTLSADALAQMEKSGFLDELDRISPNADYVMLWALFYHALSKQPSDPTRAEHLSEVIATLKSNAAILSTPHEQSRVQVPAHALAGMTLRRLNDVDRARQYLAEARSLGDRLADEGQRSAAASAVLLAEIEGARLEIDAAQWHAASRGINQLRRRTQPDSPTAVSTDQAFVTQLVASLLDRDVLLGRAAEAEAAGRADDAAELRRQSWQGLLNLAVVSPLQRERMYALLFRSLPPDCNPSALDPVHQAAYIAGTLATETTPESLAKAIAAGDRFLAGLDEQSRALAPQVLRQMALAHYHQGETLAAVSRFLQIAREYPQDSNSGEAAEVAVHLTSLAGREADKSEDDSPTEIGATRSPGEDALRGADREAIARLYVDALRLLLERYPDRPAARYWRFFYAEHLFEVGEFAAALAEFRRVDPDHELALQAALRVIQVQAEAVRRASATPDADPAALRRQVDEVLNTHRELIQRLHSGPSAQLEMDEIAARSQVLAESRLTVAEVLLLPAVARYDAALDELSGFEERYGDRAELRPRLWRARILAYARAGRLHEAMEVVSVYVQADPDNAGATLQSLFKAAYEDLNRTGAAAESSKATALRQGMLHLAKALSRWAEGQDQLSAAQRKAIKVQLGEAHLAAGEADFCRVILEPLVSGSLQRLPTDADDLRALLAYAKALAALNRCNEALPLFNRIAVGLSPQADMRWEGLIGDLQCRTQLAEPPDGIVRVIQQQRAFHPSLGGPRHAARIEQLLRENERRRAGNAEDDQSNTP